MIAQLATYWRERSQRERVLLSVMIVIAGAMILWLGVALPLAAARVRADTRLAEASAQAGLVAARQGSRTAGRTVPDAVGLVRASGEAAGFTLTRAENDGSGGVTVAVASAKAPALFAWLTGLEKQGLSVSTIDLRANPDNSLTVTATLRGGR